MSWEKATSGGREIRKELLKSQDKGTGCREGCSGDPSAELGMRLGNGAVDQREKTSAISLPDFSGL